MLFAWWPLIGIWLVNERLHPPADNHHYLPPSHPLCSDGPGLMVARWRTKRCVSKGTRRSSAAPRHQYLWHANPQLRIPRHSATESRSFGKRHRPAKRRKEEIKSYLTNADRCHCLLRFASLPFPFSFIMWKSKTPDRLIHWEIKWEKKNTKYWKS